MVSLGQPAEIWCLRVHGRDVRCLRQTTGAGLELRILWGDELFLTEMFPDADRLAARAEEFRSTLEARGWRPGHEDGALQSLGSVERPGGETADGGSGEASGGPFDDSVRAGEASSGAGRLPTVLVVDDETAVRSFLRVYLEEADYHVVEAVDVDSALSVLDQTPVDAVVLDVRMPDPMGWERTGLEVLAFIRLHAAFATLPVLILTGCPLDPEEHDLVRRHHAHLFLKPDGYRKLLQRLHQLTGRREIGRP